MSDEPKITSGDLKVGLRAALAKGYQVFFEVGNDTGTRVTRHADAVAIGIWPSEPEPTYWRPLPTPPHTKDTP